MAFSVLFTRALDRAGIPIVLLFLVLGMLGGSEGLGGVRFDDHAFAFRIGTIALVLILFDGGLNTSWRSVRRAAGPATTLATIGVVLTAAVLTLAGRALGLPWSEAALIAAIVSSTDAAAVFAILRGGGLRLRRRVRETLEVESCVNDPMAVILTLALIEIARAGAAPPWWIVALIPVQLALGALVGLAVGLGVRWMLGRARVSASGLFAVVTTASAFIAFGLATLSYGNGFLAVFVCAVTLGASELPYRAGLRRIHDALAWMSQVGMFLMLGLLVFPSRLAPVAGIGLVLGLTLAFVARPLAVAACLALFRWPRREVAYVGWVGIRGAVPIVLATFPSMAGLPGADRVFHTVFFIVVLSTLAPGASIRAITRRLGLEEPGAPLPSAALELNSLRPLERDIRVYHISPAVAACNATLAEITFPPEASAILVVRGETPIAARGSTRLLPGDHVFIFCRREGKISTRKANQLDKNCRYCAISLGSFGLTC